MKIIGAALLLETVKGLADGSLHVIDQSLVIKKELTVLKHAPKIFTETCQLHWTETVDTLHNLVRGLSPFPGALTVLDGKVLKVYRSKKEHNLHKHPVGKVLSDGKTFLKFACANGYLHILDMQLEGKKRMLVQDFLRGYRISSVADQSGN
jgi:methionyl-tRNA formyltransferase